jgi:hypothetical protein
MSKHVATIDFTHELEGSIKNPYHNVYCVHCKEMLDAATTDAEAAWSLMEEHILENPTHHVIIGTLHHLTWEESNEETE